MHYKLFQDGEINFTIQNSENRTTGIFSVKECRNAYRIYFTDLSKLGFPNTSPVADVYDKERAILQAYKRARFMGREFDPDFEDKTELGKLEEFAQEPILQLSPEARQAAREVAREAYNQVTSNAALRKPTESQTPRELLSRADVEDIQIDRM